MRIILMPHQPKSWAQSFKWQRSRLHVPRSQPTLSNKTYQCMLPMHHWALTLAIR